MKNCSNLFYLSSVAYKLSECMSEEELAVFASVLIVLGDMLASILARQACVKDEQD